MIQPAPLPVCDIPERGPDIPSEDDTGICHCPLLLHGFPMRRLEELLTQAQVIFDQLTMMAVLSSIQTAEEVPPDFLHARHVTGTPQDHHMKDDEPLSVSAALSDSGQIRGHRTGKALFDLPTGRIVPLQW